MVNEQRALRRVGEWAGLREDLLETYLKTAHNVHNERLRATGEDYDLSSEYFSFLNNQVFSNDRVVTLLDDIGVEDEVLQQFAEGVIDIDDTFHSYGKTGFDLDELVDFIMMLKFIKRYCEETGRETIKPRNRLQNLLYLVNYHLSTEPDPYLPERENEWGLLWRTGYRYDFRKLNIGPGSSWLYTDKDRLSTWQLLDEDVVETGLSDIDEPFGISLGQVGSLLLTRYGRKIRNFDSLVLRKWDEHQQTVIKEYGTMDQNRLYEHVTEVNEYQEKRDGQILLNGRPLQFEEAARKELQDVTRLMPAHA